MQKMNHIWRIIAIFDPELNARDKQDAETTTLIFNRIIYNNTVGNWIAYSDPYV